MAGWSLVFPGRESQRPPRGKSLLRRIDGSCTKSTLLFTQLAVIVVSLAETTA